jgi:hypothetical protein
MRIFVRDRLESGALIGRWSRALHFIGLKYGLKIHTLVPCLSCLENIIFPSRSKDEVGVDTKRALS